MFKFTAEEAIEDRSITMYPTAVRQVLKSHGYYEPCMSEELDGFYDEVKPLANGEYIAADVLQAIGY